MSSARKYIGQQKIDVSASNTNQRQRKRCLSEYERASTVLHGRTQGTREQMNYLIDLKTKKNLNLDIY